MKCFKFGLWALFMLMTTCSVAASAERWRRSRTVEALQARLLERIDANDLDGAIRVASRAESIHPGKFESIQQLLHLKAEVRRGEYPAWLHGPCLSSGDHESKQMLPELVCIGLAKNIIPLNCADVRNVLTLLLAVLTDSESAQPSPREFADATTILSR